jgi:hypothetical protein
MLAKSLLKHSIPDGCFSEEMGALFGAIMEQQPLTIHGNIVSVISSAYSFPGATEEQILAARQYSAVYRVLNTAELLERILLELSPQDLLLRASLTCSDFKSAIDGSLHLRRMLFREPQLDCDFKWFHLMPTSGERLTARTIKDVFHVRCFTNCHPMFYFRTVGFESLGESLVSQPPLQRCRICVNVKSSVWGIEIGGSVHTHRIDLPAGQSVTFDTILRIIARTYDTVVSLGTVQSENLLWGVSIQRYRDASRVTDYPIIRIRGDPPS